MSGFCYHTQTHNSCINCMCVFSRTLDTMTVEERTGTVYLTISRSNGLESAVSVEWETRSGTAFGMSKKLH